MKNEGLTKLITGCRNNDRRSQKALYDRFYGYALSVALPYCHDTAAAREIVNDAFLKAFAGIQRFHPEKPFNAWLRVIVVRTAVNHYRHQLTEMTTFDLDEAVLPAVEDDCLSKLAAEDILSLLHKLSPAYRITLSLYALEGLEHQEIAELLDISVGTSKSNLFKARAKLKQLMAGEYFPDFIPESGRDTSGK